MDYGSIMEYGSTPYAGMAQKKMAATLTVYKICSNVCYAHSHSFYELHLLFSGIFIIKNSDTIAIP